MKKNLKAISTVRSFLYENVDVMLDSLSKRREAGKIDTEDLFGGGDGGGDVDAIIWKKHYVPHSILETLINEKDSLGLYVSGNPILRFAHIEKSIREALDKEDLHLILVDKIKKVFTRSNMLMCALQISTTHPDTKYEGIVFPKVAPNFAGRLEDKTIYWVKGRELKNRTKKKEGEENEYQDLPKIGFEEISKFTDGPLPLFVNDEIKIPMNRAKEIEKIDWQKTFDNPTEIAFKNKEETKEPEIKVIQIPESTPIDQIKTIKSMLKKDYEPGLEKVKLELEKNGEYKKVKGEFWADYKSIMSLI